MPRVSNCITTKKKAIDFDKHRNISRAMKPRILIALQRTIFCRRARRAGRRADLRVGNYVSYE